MGWFNFARSEGFPTAYAPQHISATFDVLTFGILIALGILTVSFLVILPAYGNWKRRCLWIRIIISLATGGIVLVCNYGQNWEVGTASVITPYKPHSAEEIKAVVGLHVTLRGINVTLKGVPYAHNFTSTNSSELSGERIDYNEHFSWEWAQGRLGFGKYAGKISQDFRAGAERGLPLPILQIAEYFTFDGEGLRFGRYYRSAGWFSHLLMWSAFGCWILCNILFCMIVSTALNYLIGMGALQLGAIGIWYFHRNPIEIQIPFQSGENPEEDILLKTRFGLDFYLVLANGIFCVILGICLMFVNSLWPDEMCKFFGIDPLTIYDELLLSKDELEYAKNVEGSDKEEFLELGHVSSNPNAGQGQRQRQTQSQVSKKVSFCGDEIDEDVDEERQSLVLRRRKSFVASSIFQRSFKKPKPKPRNAARKLLDEGESGRLLDKSSDDEGTSSWTHLQSAQRPPTPPRNKKPKHLSP